MRETVASPYDCKKISYRTLINGNISPWVMRFIKSTGKCINRYDMIRENETVLLAVSGGKDSLALALALSLRRKWLPVSYNLKAVMINWLEHPIDVAMQNRLKEYFKDLDIDFRIVNENQFSSSFNGEFNCYLCARNRRRILFTLASEMNCSLIAMGHHLNDIVETAMMNQFFRASIETMKPVQEFFDGKCYVIRPMSEIREEVLLRLSETYDLPVVKPVCPYDSTNIRASLKPIVKELCKLDKLAREHVYDSFDFSDIAVKRNNNSSV